MPKRKDGRRLGDRCRDLFLPAPSAGPEQIGLELELIPVSAATHRRCPIEDTTSADGSARPATLPILRRVAAREGWSERPSPYGAPVFVLSDGAAISYEPGGQIEYSAAPADTVSGLVNRTLAVIAQLRAAAGAVGIELLTLGIDPCNALDAVPLQLHGARYTAMDRYFAAIGSAGACMMRQTAACQITVTAGADPIGRWRMLCAMAPYATALFANSPRYAGAATGYVSTRAHVWRAVDPARTGLPAATAEDPAAAYEAFALAAPAILHRSAEGRFLPFAELLARGDVTEADWAPHLTTLFPEVRPRRIAGTATFELRSADAIPVEWTAALGVFVAGILFDSTAQRAASALAGTPHPSLLARAAQAGLGDVTIGQIAQELYLVALDGARRLGDRLIGAAALDHAEEFARRRVLAGPPTDGEVRSKRSDAAWRGFAHCEPPSTWRR